MLFLPRSIILESRFNVVKKISLICTCIYVKVFPFCSLQLVRHYLYFENAFKIWRVKCNFTARFSLLIVLNYNTETFWRFLLCLYHAAGEFLFL